ncbi:carbonic anhydrase [Desulfitobacterium dichloroeliminans LMG P-21439]|uniref:Carbonic anhydrase n=1 Tax=Desulfitobacterium dichloroeliminans (strain LMG P-21439 / DCA1) TaxID=871963 RepID=L0F8I8_DESDL|nr:carbonic anhydrase [Desulfitobacterium dichloroeliminans]AGA69268.1 carbonic anhydrase [Desulfitobacterium dichloroeliminans LMG P-21439]
MSFTQKLIDGIVNFRKVDFETHKNLFQELKDGQKPHTLFIACSDSRIDPNMITGALPGELFIIRNVANIIPPYRETTEYVATTSAIEYAVQMLEVENIIVCGHSNCGGCSASLNASERLTALPHTKKWLELIEPVKNRVLKEFSADEPEAREWMMEQVNVVEQLRHLMSYPYIYDKVMSGQLIISGWHYMIETGEVFIYDRKAGEFRLANGV